jgi:hypothetical protein
MSIRIGQRYTDGNAHTIAGALAYRKDDPGAGTVYEGDAEPGSASNAAVWRIKRTVTSGGSITVTWADGNGNFDNVWDNRASLSYS